ncbi:hypothetical protein PFISCL1PPCAC_5499, partial [Pristionchus fissidentatus]
MQVCLQLISQDCGDIDVLIDKLKNSLPDAHFTTNLIQKANMAAIAIKSKSRALHKEVPNIRGRLVMEMNAMDLDDFSEMGRCIEELESTIDDFPVMKSQSMTECLTQQMEKLEV